MSLATVILAAGLGTRMKSDKAKVLHTVAGRPMIEYPVAMARALGSTRVIGVLGHQADAVRAAVEKRFGAGSIEVAIQAEQRGTGHAVMQVEPLLAAHDGLVLILYGDTPLLSLAGARAAGAGRLADDADDDDGAPARSARLRPHRARRLAASSRASSRRRTPRSRSGASTRSTPASTAGRRASSSTPCAPSAATTRRAKSTSPTSWSAPHASSPSSPSPPPPTRSWAATTASTWPRPIASSACASPTSSCAPAWRCAIPSGSTSSPASSVGRDTALGPGVELRGTVKIGSGCNIEAGAVLTDCTIGDRVHVKPYCVMSGVDRRQQRADRPVVPHPPGQRHRRRRAPRQLRRDQEDAHEARAPRPTT